MIKDLTRTISYMCPFCSSTTVEYIDVFSFSGNPGITLKCSDIYCKENCVIISQKAEKYIINVDCPVCGESHSYPISKSAFWSRELLEFECPNSGISIFFCGEDIPVKEAVVRNENEIAEFSESLEDFSDDIKIVFETLDILHELLSKESLVCPCGCSSILPEMSNDGIILICEDCDTKYKITPSGELLAKLKSTKDKFILSNEN